MPDRPNPPADITPHEFFTSWIPAAVAGDADRRDQLGSTEAILEFDVWGEGGGVFTLRVSEGVVRGAPGAAEDANLRVRVDIETWRELNRREISAPHALLKRRIHLKGDFLLALKLHLILG